MNWPIALGVLLKPKVILAMAALYITTFFSAVLRNPGDSINFNLFTMGLLAVLISVSGANALNCYFDRDIDSIMVRTQGRRIAIGIVGATETRSFGVLLLLISLAISINLGMVPFMILVTGAGFYLLLYTSLLKRRTIFNVAATLPSIASPAFFGWYLGGAPISPVGIGILLIIAIWGPLHLWTLAYAFSKDYSRTEVPMFTSVSSPITASNTIILTLMLQVLSSYILAYWAKTSLYIVGISIFNIIILLYGFDFYRDRSNRKAYRIFKLTAPYIIVLLSLFVLDHWV